MWRGWQGQWVMVGLGVGGTLISLIGSGYLFEGLLSPQCFLRKAGSALSSACPAEAILKLVPNLGAEIRVIVRFPLL